MIVTIGQWVGSIGIHWVEPRDATKHLIMHRTDPTTKNYLTQNVDNINDEKPLHLPEVMGIKLLSLNF